jgi:sterol desaturase/sphingolipid hydroxylase (fatty acid hydroxylase superfamily)
VIKQYWFWLVVVSLAVLVVERLRPWREQKQPWRRDQWYQDLFWLAFNGYLFGLIAAPLFNVVASHTETLLGSFFGAQPASFKLLGGLPFWAQLPLAMLIVDFVEWSVHNLLHRVPLLWRIHRVHHSIHTMDWIGNFRFHWGEIVIYSAIRYVPAAMLGVPWQVGLTAGVIATTIGHLNHANLDISWGPLKVILNSPRMHLWHHDANPATPAGVNFGVVFSIWDWIFRTAYLPAHPPERIGFEGDQKLSKGLFGRFFLPFVDLSTSEKETESGCLVPGNTSAA